MGLSSTLLRDVPFSAIYWLNYETIKSFSSQHTFAFNLAAGATAGSVCAIIIYYHIVMCMLSEVTQQ